MFDPIFLKTISVSEGHETSRFAKKSVSNKDYGCKKEFENCEGRILFNNEFFFLQIIKIN